MIAAAVLATCSWNSPGANPYRHDPVQALASYHLTAAERAELTAKMRAYRFDDAASITRDGIRGRREYTDLRAMHFGAGAVCAQVDRSAWGARQELGLVYCSGDTCVIVPTVCNNVSLVTRVGAPPPPGPAASAESAGAGAPPPPFTIGVAPPVAPGPVEWAPLPAVPWVVPQQLATPVPYLPAPQWTPTWAPVPVPVPPVPEPATWVLLVAGLLGLHRLAGQR